MNTLFLELLLLAVVAFIQNMAFTWVSRSRNSGDPSYHRWAAICSNGIWFVTTLLIWNQIWSALTAGEWWRIVLTGVAYVAATTEGSVLMMKILLKKETGKRKVGAA
jgi:hypothetical protein